MRWPASPEAAVERLKWHRWFAWHPVRVGDDKVWLEILERRGTFHYDSLGGSYSYEYRNPQTVTGD